MVAKNTSSPRTCGAWITSAGIAKLQRGSPSSTSNAPKTCAPFAGYALITRSPPITGWLISGSPSQRFQISSPVSAFATKIVQLSVLKRMRSRS
jgi:hypothetical protein